MEAVGIPALAELTANYHIFQQEIQLELPQFSSEIHVCISEWLRISRESQASKAATWENLLNVVSKIGMDSLAKNMKDYLNSTGELYISSKINTVDRDIVANKIFRLKRSLTKIL